MCCFEAGLRWTVYGLRSFYRRSGLRARRTMSILPALSGSRVALQGAEFSGWRSGVRDQKDFVVDFCQTDCPEFGILAGTGYASAVFGFEDCAVGGADQVALLIGQETVWRPVERAALVGADIQPGAGLALMTGGNKKQRLFSAPGFKLTKLALDQPIGPAKELAGPGGVCTVT